MKFILIFLCISILIGFINSRDISIDFQKTNDITKGEVIFSQWDDRKDMVWTTLNDKSVNSFPKEFKFYSLCYRVNSNYNIGCYLVSPKNNRITIKGRDVTVEDY
ncbi:hypothetical protein DICPUDRAFT_82836 [Dictyostelium purpureum]|uniref:Uncharacterized protein n=1 Tax=Dictyostelium purpureum TaxID=5786 RepID=F0ZXS1_DICPU|nr:uncharacterized protein DICPUDRAFT_82836 [Dictyostelium purpureum]EGC31262.1 hypothetical protein DICPUDRAFT_82836 [Dictyostelium purpureum]|eukprot:XP_003292207.1 hypothetical protein DICPUDRAFT_82836 [Dictyostelium purpureum]